MKPSQAISAAILISLAVLQSVSARAANQDNTKPVAINADVALEEGVPLTAYLVAEKSCLALHPALVFSGVQRASTNFEITYIAADNADLGTVTVSSDGQLVESCEFQPATVVIQD